MCSLNIERNGARARVRWLSGLEKIRKHCIVNWNKKTIRYCDECKDYANRSCLLKPWEGSKNE